MKLSCIMVNVTYPLTKSYMVSQTVSKHMDWLSLSRRASNSLQNTEAQYPKKGLANWIMLRENYSHPGRDNMEARLPGHWYVKTIWKPGCQVIGT